MDVLFLSVSAGGGHIKAAEAVKEYMGCVFPDSRALIVDTLKYVNPVVDKLVIGSYLNAVKNTPQIYGKLYDMAESGDNINDFSKTVNKLLAYRVKDLIREFSPSVIVCTHPFPVQMISTLKRKNKIDIPAVTIVTDFIAHPLWLHDHIDAYVVPNEFIKYEMIDKGIPSDIIFPYGIPISNSFLHKKSRQAVLEELGLDNKPTILIMGGSQGFGEVLPTFLSILECKKDLQIIAVTGTNLKLKRQLEKHAALSRKKVLILSYTHNISDLMDISDLIITKPGGMTVSEALVKELPMLIISPIPGQEERNAHLLVNNGVAARITSTCKIDSILYQIMDNPLRIKHMKEMARYLSKPHATRDIVDLLHKLASKKLSLQGGPLTIEG